MHVSKALPVILSGIILSTGIAAASVTNSRKAVAVIPEAEAATTVSVEYNYTGISPAMSKKIKAWEGYTAYAKDDCGVPAYGYGHRSESIRIGDYCSPELAEELFRQDIAFFENGARKFEEANGIKFTWFEFDAVVTFMYNFGTKALDKGYKCSELGERIVAYKRGQITIDSVVEQWKVYCHYKTEDGEKHFSQGLYDRRVMESGWFSAKGICDTNDVPPYCYEGR